MPARFLGPVQRDYHLMRPSVIIRLQACTFARDIEWQLLPAIPRRRDAAFALTRSPTTSMKPLIATSLALALLAMSASSYAGATVSDKRYLPSEARPSAYVVGPQSSAFAWRSPRPRQRQVPRKAAPQGRVRRSLVTSQLIPQESTIRLPIMVISVLCAVSAPQFAHAQIFDPSYPVCLQPHALDNLDCHFTSPPQCALTASGLGAECVVDPYYAAKATIGEARQQHDKRTRRGR